MLWNLQAFPLTPPHLLQASNRLSLAPPSLIGRVDIAFGREAPSNFDPCAQDPVVYPSIMKSWKCPCATYRSYGFVDKLYQLLYSVQHFEVGLSLNPESAIIERFHIWVALIPSVAVSFLLELPAWLEFVSLTTIFLQGDRCCARIRSITGLLTRVTAGDAGAIGAIVDSWSYLLHL